MGRPIAAILIWTSLALALVLAARRGLGARAGAGPAAPSAAQPAERTARALEEPRSIGGAARAAAAGLPAQPPAPEPPGDLRARLARLGGLYVESARLARAPALPAALERELKDVLEPLVNAPDDLARALALLASGALAPADGARALAPEELGAIWAQAWAVRVHHAGGELLRPGAPVDARRTVLAALEALARIREPAALELARHLGGARDRSGAPILASAFLPDVLAVAAAHPGSPALGTLLLLVAGGLEPKERALALRLVLAPGDPELVAAEIRALLGGPDEARGVELADRWFAEAQDRALRARIAETVARHAADPFVAAGFVARHAEALSDEVGVLMTLGIRPDAPPALAAEYHALASARVRERGRVVLVEAMVGSEPAELLAIARDDPSADVQASALQRAAARRDWQPTDEALERLRDVRAALTPRTALRAIESARDLALGFQRAGRPRQAGEAAAILRELAHAPGVPDGNRRVALEALARVDPDAADR